MNDINKNRGITCTLNFKQPSKTIWNIISAPNNLELFHPFCKENTVVSWNSMPYIDELEYLNGLKYFRKFVNWDPLKGYTLNIGKKEGKQSHVIWEIKEIDDLNCSLSITVYPHLLSNWPNFFSYIPYKLFIKPRLYNYLFSVISGLKYHLDNNKKVPKNHFGKHKWFS